MKFDKFKDLFCTNLLSIIGYIYLIYYLWIHFYYEPLLQQDIIKNSNVDIELSQVSHNILYFNAIIAYTILSILVFIILSVLILIECILREKNIIPELKTPNNKIYKTSFIIGLLLQLTPILYLFLIFIFPIVRYNLMNN